MAALPLARLNNPLASGLGLISFTFGRHFRQRLCGDPNSWAQLSPKQQGQMTTKRCGCTPVITPSPSPPFQNLRTPQQGEYRRTSRRKHPEAAITTTGLAPTAVALVAKAGALLKTSH
jgi:hypothetical protein